MGKETSICMVIKFYPEQTLCNALFFLPSQDIAFVLLICCLQICNGSWMGRINRTMDHGWDVSTGQWITDKDVPTGQWIMDGMYQRDNGSWGWDVPTGQWIMGMGCTNGTMDHGWNASRLLVKWF
ncbi:hypothetical protein CDAR_534121 [Caerostris darwini]|uniref:Uncharacterized protein n=1 Tax=Caerostris darwini TaxID=1538125 RepID=A0AAV4S8N4_9ARAC|nr:hypothetical protein CDAR_534121 [Caerostris darwini]